MMLSKPFILLRRAWRTLSLRVIALSVLAVLVAALGPIIDPLIPLEWANTLSDNAVLPVLNVLASGLLAVTTFSLNVMVSAFRAAASDATPRAYQILLDDGATQISLGTFVGGFVYALTAIILYHAGFYGEDGSFTLFVATIAIVVLIVFTILRWINLLSKLGSMAHTLEQVSTRATEVLKDRASEPCMGCKPYSDDADIPTGARAVGATRSGYVQVIDTENLNACLRKNETEAYITAAPGTYVLKGRPVMYLTRESGLKDAELCRHMVIAQERSYEQDARFGVIVLSEIGVRALSPGINDPGTAIDVANRLTRVLWDHGDVSNAARKARFGNLHVKPISSDDLVADAFGPLIRDGAGCPELLRVLQSRLSSFEDHPNADLRSAARRMRDYLIAHGRNALEIEADLAHLEPRP